MEANNEQTIEQALQDLTITIDPGTIFFMQSSSPATTYKSRIRITKTSVIALPCREEIEEAGH